MISDTDMFSAGHINVVNSAAYITVCDRLLLAIAIWPIGLDMYMCMQSVRVDYCKIWHSYSASPKSEVFTF